MSARATKNSRALASVANPTKTMHIEIHNIDRWGHIIVVDIATHFPYVTAIENMTINSLCNKIQQWFLIIGTPDKVQTKGNIFLTSEFQRFCTMRNITRIEQKDNTDVHLDETLDKIKDALTAKSNDPRAFNVALHTWRTTDNTLGGKPYDLMYSKLIRSNNYMISPLTAQHPADTHCIALQKAKHVKIDMS